MENALNPPHTFLIPSLGGKNETLKKSENPYFRHLLLSGKVQVPGQGGWPKQLLHLQDVNFNHIYSNIPRWSPVEGFPEVRCSCSRPTDGTLAPPPPPSSSRSAYYLRWTKLHFLSFSSSRSSAGSLRWTKWCPFLDNHFIWEFANI